MGADIILATAISASGFIQCILFAIVSVSLKTENKTPKVLFGLFMLSMGLVFFDTFSELSLFYQHYPYLIKVMDSTYFLLTPFFYLYISSVLDKNFKLSLLSYLHFIPGVLVFILLFVLTLNTPVDILTDDLKIALEPGYQLGTFAYLFFVILDIQIITYLVISFIKINNKLKENHLTYVENRNIKTLRTISLVYLFIGVFTSLMDFFPRTAVNEIIILLVTNMGVYFYLFFALRRTGLISLVPTIEDDIPKYQNSILDKKEVTRLKKELKRVMEEEELFKKSNLNLAGLAKELQVAPHTLSQVLNESLNSSFFNYINHYRIEKAKRLLLNDDSKNLKISAIALEVGFNSLSAFNSSFQKEVGTTPSKYRKESNKKG